VDKDKTKMLKLLATFALD